MLVICLLLVVNLAGLVRRVIYTCDRPGNALAQCQRVEKAYLGLLTGETVDFSGVTAAATQPADRLPGEDPPNGGDSGGERPRVVLTTDQGMATLVEPQGRPNDWDAMVAIADEVNQFLAEGDRWRFQSWAPGSLMNGAIVAYLSLFGLLMVAMDRSSRKGVRYCLERPSTLGSPQEGEQFVLSREGGGPPLHLRFGWRDVISLALHRHGGGRRHRVGYAPRLTLRQRSPITLCSYQSQLQSDALLRHIKAFLRRQPTPSNLPLGQPQSLQQDIWQGTQGRYLSTGTVALPPSERPAVRQADQAFRRLGGHYLGDLQVGRWSNFTCYVYGLPAQHSYGLIYVWGSWVSTEFYCTFANGDSLTTTSRLLLFIPWGQPQAHFRAHWGLGVSQLHQRHRQHQHHLLGTTGGLQRQVLSLTGCAQAMDDHLSQRQGLLITL
jgi:hypothetical protein